MKIFSLSVFVYSVLPFIFYTLSYVSHMTYDLNCTAYERVVVLVVFSNVATSHSLSVQIGVSYSHVLSFICNLFASMRIHLFVFAQFFPLAMTSERKWYISKWDWLYWNSVHWFIEKMWKIKSYKFTFAPNWPEFMIGVKKVHYVYPRKQTCTS